MKETFLKAVYMTFAFPKINLAIFYFISTAKVSMQTSERHILLFFSSTSSATIFNSHFHTSCAHAVYIFKYHTASLSHRAHAERYSNAYRFQWCKWFFFFCYIFFNIQFTSWCKTKKITKNMHFFRLQFHLICIWFLFCQLPSFDPF